MTARKERHQFNFWQSPQLANLTFSHGEYGEFEFLPHFHEYYIFQIVEQGTNVGICQGKKFHLQPGDVLMMNPGEIHTGASADRHWLRYQGICPEVTQLQSFLKLMEFTDQNIPEFTHMQIHAPALATQIKELIQASRQEEDTLYLQSLTIDVFQQLFRQHSTLQPQSSRTKQDLTKVKKAISFIRDQYNQSFSLEELSAFCHSDPCYLIKVFKKKTGLTPYQYLRNYRIELAKKKLQQDIPICEVALELGFFDQSHFHRHFKPITGLTPFQYKRQFRTRFKA